MKIQVLLATASIGLINAFFTGHRVTCKKETRCNGNLMCAEVCARGSVQVDEWAVNALNYQKRLQIADKMVYYEMPSTHNSAITEADNFGIEKYFISALGGGLDVNQGDDVGEGVCQYLSLTDQLRIGVRHLEIDQWWGPVEKDIIICHSPIPLYPVGKINRVAEDKGLNLEWEEKNMSCIGTKRMFKDVLIEIKNWLLLEDNKNEIITLFFDTKLPFTPEQTTKGNNDILEVFGDLVWPVTNGSPLDFKVQDLLDKNQRVIIESNKESWLNPSEGDPIVFYPTLWNEHQFSSGSFQEFPNCTISGDNDWYGKEWVRALDGSFVEAATRCNVQLISKDYINADDMKFFVWSWDQEEPSLESGCTALLPSGRWASIECNTSLPFACSEISDENENQKEWEVDLSVLGVWGENKCSEGFEFNAPHNGYANSLLVNAAFAQTVWLNAPVKW